jgi:aminoglycoside/choline kinase family phosphotransferase
MPLPHVPFKPARRFREWLKTNWTLPRRRRKDRLPLIAWAESRLDLACRAEDLEGRTNLTLRLRHAQGSHVAQRIYEARVFAKVVALGEYLRLKGVHVPRILHSDERLGFLLLEDLGSVTAHDAIEGGAASAEVLALVIRQLVRLHYAGGGQDVPVAFAPFSLDKWQYFVLKRLSWLRAFCPGISGKLLAELAQDMKSYRARLMPDQGDLRLCHLDCHLGNFMLRGSVLYVLDWASASLCPPAMDLAKFFVYSPTRTIWDARSRMVRQYMEEADLSAAEREGLSNRIHFFEIGYFLWKLPLFLYDGKQKRDFSLLGEVLRDLSWLESLDPYHSLRVVMQEVNEIFRNNGHSGG